MKKMNFLLLILLLTACQSGGSNTSSGSNTDKDKKEFEEKTTITLIQGDKEVTTKVIKDCWAKNCTEQSAGFENVNLVEMTNRIQPTKVAVDNDIKIEVDGPKPSKMSYIVQQMELHGESASIEDHSLESNKIPLHEEGAKKHYLLTAIWYNGEEFIGSTSIAFVLKIGNE
ncbi:hypothetical protein VBD025_15150 [Virgibacillus flavescens]|uniref:hypothetical protein n=1 Tax=Virgibacillus flavescens TaxID=1611422 RepID=UPI003D3514BC